MKYKDTSFFDFLNFIFKVTDEDLKNHKPSVFLTNRWVSMASPPFAKIANMTTNRWCRHLKDFDIKTFYRQLLPTYKKNITYIKKEFTEKDKSETQEMANLMECSEREILLFEQSLAHLKKNDK